MAFEDKAPQIQMLIASMTGQTVDQLRTGLLCAMCSTEINDDDFRDELSRREFQISRMCQGCQDMVFGK